MNLPKPLKVFLGLSAGLTTICIGSEAFCAWILHLPYPYNWPLTPEGEQVFDLNAYAERFKHFHKPEFFTIYPWNPFAYPAPMAMLYRVIYLIPDHRARYFLTFLALLIAAFAYLLYRASVRRGLAKVSAVLFLVCTVLLSYPFFFEAKQGNLELWVWWILCSGIWLFLRGRGYGAAACFALAGSMKLFPLIFLGLQVSKRQWREFIWGVIVMLTVTLLSLKIIGPGIASAQSHIQSGMAVFQDKIVLHVVHREIGFDHSLFSVIKRVWLSGAPSLPLPPTLLRGYLLTMAVGGTLLFFLVIRHLPVINQVLSLTICAILMPPVSYDYTLIHLYVPFAMLVTLAVDAARRGVEVRGLIATFALLAISLAPLNEIIVRGVSIGGQCRAVTLVCLFVVGLVCPFDFRVDECARVE